ncbi:MAG: hypothetical protein ABI422_07025 [Sphingomicrobium sp.]
MIDHPGFRLILVLILAAALLAATACWRRQFGQGSGYKNPRR